MKVRELAEWLLKFHDQEATVNFIQHPCDSDEYPCDKGAAYEITCIVGSHRRYKGVYD